MLVRLQGILHLQFCVCVLARALILMQPLLQDAAVEPRALNARDRFMCVEGGLAVVQAQEAGAGDTT